MAIPDLSLVTTTLLQLLKWKVDPGMVSLSDSTRVTYSGLSSDRLTGESTLGLFLHHVVEEAHCKNLPPVYQDEPPVRFTPMGLQLHYQLMAHAESADPESGVIRAQRLFGLALKTFHDYPCLTRETQVSGRLVFPIALQGTDNVFRITLKNIPTSEATNFWVAGNQPVRLAAYYEVSVVLLEPDRPQRRAGRVLRYGTQVFVNGAPRLDASRNTVTFRLPGETADRGAELQPAEAAVGDDLTFDGTDLTGDQTTLLLMRTGWTEAVEVGSEWGVVAGADRIVARVQGRAGSQTMVPGVYSAMARVTRVRSLPDGSTRTFPQSSNAVPFTVAPTITTPAYNMVATADSQQIVTVEGGIFQHADVVSEQVRVVVGGESFPLETSSPLTAGHFEVVSATRLRLRFPIDGLSHGQVLPLRVIVNGVENAPRWVRVP